MIKRLIILSLIVWCLTGVSSVVYAQEGDPEEFGKKSNQRGNESEVANQQEPQNSSPEVESPGNLMPQKENKVQSNIPSQESLDNRKSKKSTQTQVSPKSKESKSKYNILLYYFYKSKHEETDSKESTDINAS